MRILVADEVMVTAVGVRHRDLAALIVGWPSCGAGRLDVTEASRAAAGASEESAGRSLRTSPPARRSILKQINIWANLNGKPGMVLPHWRRLQHVVVVPIIFDLLPSVPALIRQLAARIEMILLRIARIINIHHILIKTINYCSNGGIIIKFCVKLIFDLNCVYFVIKCINW